jgi:hypothetical protein
VIYEMATGDYRAKQNGPNMTAAVVAAFKRRAPKNPSLLTRARAVGKPWQYIDSIITLKRAGYPVHSKPL